MFRTTGVTGTDARHPAPARRSARAAGCRGDTRRYAPPSLLRGWGNQVAPFPWLRAALSQTLPRAGVWGNRVSPHPYGMNKGCSWEGCALPDPPTGCGEGETRFPPYPCVRARALPRAGVWGNRVSPHPYGMNKGCSWEGCALPDPPTGCGEGETRFPPYPCVRARVLPRAGEWGNRVSPFPCSRRLCSR